MKSCSKCGDLKPLSEFGKKTQAKDGFQPYCKACVSAIGKAWREENREYAAARDKAWFESNAAKRSAQNRDWRQANAPLVRSGKKAYKARRRTTEKGGDPVAAILAWERAAKKVCYWCSATCADDYHVDHYQPLSKGGPHRISNLVIACPTCNLRKNAKDPLEFAASVGRLF